MPCTIKLKVNEARDLPIMDRATSLADAYVEIRFGDAVFRTAVCPKTLAPAWHADFRIDVTDDEMLQDEPLELRIYDFDTLSSNDIVGIVLLDLNPLLLTDGPSSLSGWFPIHDSLRGICGELHASVKVQYVGDINPFREASAGISLFNCSVPPQGWRVASLVGFVEELIAESDPEYHWSDTFRTMRSSNESRQLVLFKVAGRARRLLGHKALDAGANAVLGCHISMDLESQCIVGRASGTAVKLIRVQVCDDEIDYWFFTAVGSAPTLFSRFLSRYIISVWYSSP